MGGFGGVADRLNAYNVYLKDPSKIHSDVARFRNRSMPSNVRAAAWEYLVKKPRVTLTVLGREEAKAGRPDSPGSRQAAHPRAGLRFQGTDARELRTLRCGASLWVIPRRDLPIIAATAVVKAGASAHGPEAWAGSRP